MSPSPSPLPWPMSSALNSPTRLPWALSRFPPRLAISFAQAQVQVQKPSDSEKYQSSPTSSTHIKMVSCVICLQGVMGVGWGVRVGYSSSRRRGINTSRQTSSNIIFLIHQICGGEESIREGKTDRRRRRGGKEGVYTPDWCQEHDANPRTGLDDRLSEQSVVSERDSIMKTMAMWKDASTGEHGSNNNKVELRKPSSRVQHLLISRHHIKENPKTLSISPSTTAITANCTTPSNSHTTTLRKLLSNPLATPTYPNLISKQ